MGGGPTGNYIHGARERQATFTTAPSPARKRMDRGSEKPMSGRNSDLTGTPTTPRVRRNHPIGVLYDCFGAPKGLPWELTVHIRNYPETLLMRCPTINTIEVRWPGNGGIPSPHHHTPYAPQLPHAYPSHDWLVQPAAVAIRPASRCGNLPLLHSAGIEGCCIYGPCLLPRGCVMSQGGVHYRPMSLTSSTLTPKPKPSISHYRPISSTS